VRISFLAAMAEFQAEGRGIPGDTSMYGREILEFCDTWHTPEGFTDYVGSLRARADPAFPRAADEVPSKSLWWVEGEEFLGRFVVRHQLTERLRTVGGHVGYDVRSSARRAGHGTAILRAGLPVCAELGLDRVLLTVHVGNLASQRVIEANGGVLEREEQGMNLYWIDTAPYAKADFSSAA